jgi:hypothetical protein
MFKIVNGVKYLGKEGVSPMFKMEGVMVYTLRWRTNQARNVNCK